MGGPVEDAEPLFVRRLHCVHWTIEVLVLRSEGVSLLLEAGAALRLQQRVALDLASACFGRVPLRVLGVEERAYRVRGVLKSRRRDEEFFCFGLLALCPEASAVAAAGVVLHAAGSDGCFVCCECGVGVAVYKLLVAVRTVNLGELGSWFRRPTHLLLVLRVEALWLVQKGLHLTGELVREAALEDVGRRVVGVGEEEVAVHGYGVKLVVAEKLLRPLNLGAPCALLTTGALVHVHALRSLALVLGRGGRSALAQSQPQSRLH